MKTTALLCAALCAVAVATSTHAQHVGVDRLNERLQSALVIEGSKEGVVGALVGAGIGAGVGYLAGYGSGNTQKVVPGAMVGGSAGYAAGAIFKAVRDK